MYKLYRIGYKNYPKEFNYAKIIKYNLIGWQMDNTTVLDKLSEKVSQILQERQTLKSEAEAMRNELVALKANCELKNQEIDKLAEENALKDLEIEEIVNKIESILG